MAVLCQWMEKSRPEAEGQERKPGAWDLTQACMRACERTFRFTGGEVSQGALAFPPAGLRHPKNQTGCPLQPPDCPLHSPVGQPQCTELLCFQRPFHSVPEPLLWAWVGRFLASCHFDLWETPQLHLWEPGSCCQSL